MPEYVGRVIFALDLRETVVVVSVEPLRMGLALPVEGSSTDIPPLQVLHYGSPLLLHPFYQLGLVSRVLPSSPGHSHQSCLVVAGPGSRVRIAINLRLPSEGEEQRADKWEMLLELGILCFFPVRNKS